MRGNQYFDSPDWAAHYDRQVISFKGIQIRQGRNFDTEPMTREEFDRIFHSLRLEHTRWLRDQEGRREAPEADYSDCPVLDLSKLKDRTVNRPVLPPFKLNYDTIEEVRMRLNKTVIFIKGNPFLVIDVQNNRKNPETDGRFKLLVQDHIQTQSIIPLDKATDLRGCPPGYVVKDGQVGFLNRVPARVNTQGMTSQNTVIRKVGTGGSIPFNVNHLLDFCLPRKRVKWCESLAELIAGDALREVRLDDNVAVFTKPNTEKLFAEYKGRRLGEVNDDCVIPEDPDDFVQPWIVDDLRSVNLEIKG